MLGFNRTFQENSKTTLRDKMNYMLSPLNYIMEREHRNTIYLTLENVNQLKALMSNKDKQSTDLKEI